MRRLLVAVVVAASLSGRAAAWQFTDVTAAAGVGVTHRWIDPEALDQVGLVAAGVAAGDADGDGLVDLYVVGGDAGANHLFHNQGDGTFVDVAVAAGVALGGSRSCGPVFADVDGDGHLDLLVLGVAGTRPTLFRNDGDGTFTDVTAGSGLDTIDGNTISAAFGDFDRDGDLDLFLTHWGTPNGRPSSQHLWRNDGGFHFTDVSASSGVMAAWAERPLDLSFTPNFVDVNEDGWPDILVSSDFGSSRVFINRGDGTFRDATDPAVVTDENGMGSAIGDWDGDGHLDWFVSSIWEPSGVAGGNWGTTGNRLYRGHGDGTFEDATDVAGVRHGFWGWGSTFADLDDDGWLDLFHVNGWSDPHAVNFQADPARLFVGTGGGGAMERSAAVGLVDDGDGRGVVAFDYDRDGDLDLFVSNNQQATRLWRNDRDDGAHFLTVKLRGLSPNTEGIGALVLLRAGGRTQRRVIRAGSNFVSQDPAEAHFGLGTVMTVDEVEVDWLDGTKSHMGPLEADRFITIAEPDTTGSPCGAGAGCVAGGGDRSSDCVVEWRVPGRVVRPNRPRVICRDGDASCDAEPSRPGCTFTVSVCTAVDDPRLPACHPAGPVAIEATGRLAALSTKGLSTGNVPGQCTAAVPVRVKARPGGHGVTVRVDARSADGIHDADALSLRCRPPRHPRARRGTASAQRFR
jgi:enediyne biosynthesis protein E4